MSGWLIGAVAAVAFLSVVVALNAGRIVCWLWPDGGEDQ